MGRPWVGNCRLTNMGAGGGGGSPSCQHTSPMYGAKEAKPDMEKGGEDDRACATVMSTRGSGGEKVSMPG